MSATRNRPLLVSSERGRLGRELEETEAVVGEWCRTDLSA